MLTNPIFCAIDTTDLEKAKRLIADIAPFVGGIKLGLEFFTHHGAEGVKRVMPGGLPLFLDLKFHDIPNTVAGAVRALSGLNIFMLTVHTQGGVAMMQAAKEAALSLPAQPKVLGVTVLTSLQQQDLIDAGISSLSIAHYAQALAANAKKAGIDGIVCSGHELVNLRTQIGEASSAEPALSALHGAASRQAPEAFLYVVPGIRPAGSAAGDQKRIMTPKDALAAGATHLVIGRPITEAESPAKAAEEILRSLA